MSRIVIKRVFGFAKKIFMTKGVYELAKKKFSGL
jgi:hypothetical protein